MFMQNHEPEFNFSIKVVYATYIKKLLEIEFRFSSYKMPIGLIDLLSIMESQFVLIRLKEKSLVN